MATQSTGILCWYSTTLNLNYTQPILDGFEISAGGCTCVWGRVSCHYFGIKEKMSTGHITISKYLGAIVKQVVTELY